MFHYMNEKEATLNVKYEIVLYTPVFNARCPPLRSARGLDKENWVNILINTFGQAGRLTPQPHPPNLFYKFPIYW